MTEHNGNAGTTAKAASLTLRLAAMIYEAVLLFGVVFAVSYALLASMQWSYPLPPGPRVLMQTAIFITIGAYFVFCWTRSGQTLALKAWHLMVTDEHGKPPHLGRAIARYILAWHLWLPGLLLGWRLHLDIASTLVATAAGFALLLIPALMDRDRRLLHDRCSGTRIVRMPL
ncbi:MAG: RDD family protein [Burkholderiaceae bacterium]